LQAVQSSYGFVTAGATLALHPALAVGGETGHGTADQ